MAYIANRGSQSSRLWIICERPFTSDEKASILFSGGMGAVFAKMLREAGLDINNCFVCSRRPDTDAPSAIAVLENDLEHFKPPLILVLNEVGNYFLPELRNKKDVDEYRGQLQKNAGSLLHSDMLSYPHYMMPIYGPDRCVADWAERNVTTYVDLQKMRDELAYWKKHGVLQPLPERTLKFHDMDIDELLMYLERFRGKLIADDIENPVYNSKLYKPHPGYPIVLGLADSPTFAISFKMFREKPSENRALWRKLDQVFTDCELLGQNFFNYDALYHEMLGFKINLSKVKDVLIRHHTLWPELSHKLSFMCRQYTREPFYKDDGKQWSVKQMNYLRRYNCLDCCITYEVYLGQEEEFKLRKQIA